MVARSASSTPILAVVWLVLALASSCGWIVGAGGHHLQESEDAGSEDAGSEDAGSDASAPTDPSYDTGPAAETAAPTDAFDASAECGSDACCGEECRSEEACSRPGMCADASCDEVSDHVYYVDAANPGTDAPTGSSLCPFKSLTQALAFVTHPSRQENAMFSVKIVLRSAISTDTEGTDGFPISVGSRIWIEGASDDMWPTITVPDGSTAFVFSYAKPNGALADGGISKVNIQQTTTLVDSARQGSGIWIYGTHPDIGQPLTDAGAIHVNQVAIRRFHYGIELGSHGHVVIGDGVSATGNYRGVFADSSYVQIRASANMPSHFDNNLFGGVYVQLACILEMVGAPVGDAGANAKSITADRNEYGVRLGCRGAVPPGLAQQIRDVQMNGNVGPSRTGAGLFIFAGGPPFTLRSSILANNYQGV
jgi:hypothetical protein